LKLKPGQQLKSLDPEDLGALFSHPIHRENFGRVASLIALLRECETPQDYYEFQQHLFKDVYETEERRAQCSRVLKRFRDGETPPHDIQPPVVGDASSIHAWELEAYVFERVVRQLRTVGDGLAWRVLGYDRRVILTLARNDSPGMMFGKEGLPYELGCVEDLWRDKKHFGLLHDLTNCLRMADVSEFTNDGILLHEVKKTARTNKKQRERIQAAINAIMQGDPVPGSSMNTRLVELEQPYAADLGMLNDAIQLAHEHASRGMRLGQGRALVATAPYEVAAKWRDDFEKGARWLESIQVRATKRAKIHEASHHIRGWSADLSSRTPTLAPWSIYPFSAEDCAALICDYVMFETIISVNALAESLAAVGLQVEVVLPPAHGELVGDMNILRASLGDRTMTLHPHGLNSLLYELLRPNVWAAGIKESLANMSESGEPLLVFAGEARWWAQ
jgi:hypothetical protein